MSDTTTVSLRRDEFWQPRVDLTIVGPLTSDQAHYYGIDLDTAAGHLARYEDCIGASVTICGIADSRRVLAALGATNE